MSDMLELPKEIMLGLPNIGLIGKEELRIENHKGIAEYSKEYIRIETKSGILSINGANMRLVEISRDQITITGSIKSISY